MTKPTLYRIDPQQEVVLISNKWHRLVDVQRALTGQGVLVPEEPDGCQCEACTRKHESGCNVHNGELRTVDGCTCGAWPRNRSECGAPYVCGFCGGAGIGDTE